MPDSYTETTKISYGQNIKNSLAGMVVGIILFLLSFVVLWINEGNNVNQIFKANYMEKNAIEISADNINHENDNKLVQLSGSAITDAALTDGIITIPNSFALKRTVEMYQWQENVKTETKDNLGGSTTETKTYSYERVWSSHEINSSDFNYISNARELALVKKAENVVSESINNLNATLPFEIVADDLRISYVALGEIIGETYEEDILDEIFSKFCVGK